MTVGQNPTCPVSATFTLNRKSPRGDGPEPSAPDSYTIRRLLLSIYNPQGELVTLNIFGGKLDCRRKELEALCFLRRNLSLSQSDEVLLVEATVIVHSPVE